MTAKSPGAKRRGAITASLVAALLAATVAQATDAPVSTPATQPAQPQKSQPPANSKPQPAEPQKSKASQSQTSSTASANSRKRKAHASRYAPDRFAGRAGKFYELTWGVDSLKVKLVESGELVRFSYRVLDPVKAKLLNDKQTEASLIDPKAGVRLSVPTMEKVGQLRQSAPPEAGRSYWMTFSNKGGHVVRGDRVDVVIGTFKANFLAVD